MTQCETTNGAKTGNGGGANAWYRILTVNALLTQIRDALQRLQDEKKYFSIAVYRIDGEYAMRIASAGATCGQCDRVHLSTGNIGRVARSGLLHAIDDVSMDPSYKSCFSQVRSETVVPIVVFGKTIGVIDVESGSGPIDGTELQDFAKEIARLLERI